MYLLQVSIRRRSQRTASECRVLLDQAIANVDIERVSDNNCILCYCFGQMTVRFPAMRPTYFALLLPLCLACFVGGCQKSDEDRTLIGTNEQNKHLRERVTELDAELERTKAEASAARATEQSELET